MASTDGPITKDVWFKKSMTLTLLSTPFKRKLFCPFERTPLAENPPPVESLAPGSLGTTPGDIRAKYAKLRVPPNGIWLICLEVMFAPMMVDSVCSAGVSLVTSMLTVISPTCSWTSMPVRSPAVSWMLRRVDFLNPAASTVTVYTPGFNAGRAYSPEFPAVTSYFKPVAVSSSVTFAFGMAAPDWSVIVPTRVARSRCANRLVDNRNVIRTTFVATTRRMDFPLDKRTGLRG